MFTFEEAVQIDIQDIQHEYIKAAQAYESVNKHFNAPVESFINLACIYWLTFTISEMLTFIPNK